MHHSIRQNYSLNNYFMPIYGSGWLQFSDLLIRNRESSALKGFILEAFDNIYAITYFFSHLSK